MSADTWDIVVTTPDAVVRDHQNIIHQLADLRALGRGYPRVLFAGALR